MSGAPTTRRRARVSAGRRSTSPLTSTGGLQRAIVPEHRIGHIISDRRGYLNGRDRSYSILILLYKRDLTFRTREAHPYLAMQPIDRRSERTLSGVGPQLRDYYPISTIVCISAFGGRLLNRGTTTRYQPLKKFCLRGHMLLNRGTTTRHQPLQILP